MFRRHAWAQPGVDQPWVFYNSLRHYQDRREKESAFTDPTSLAEAMVRPLQVANKVTVLFLSVFLAEYNQHVGVNVLPPRGVECQPS